MHEICKDLSPSSQCDLSTFVVGLIVIEADVMFASRYRENAYTRHSWVPNNLCIKLAYSVVGS
jgi:hypothetical protein